MKPQKPKKRKAEPQFDHKTDRLDLLSGLLTEWFGAHNAPAGVGAVSSGNDGRFAGGRKGAAKGRQ